MMGCGQCRPVDGLHPPTGLGQRSALPTLPTAPATSGPLFNDQVDLFSVITL
jgi:hypothetical protein